MIRAGQWLLASAALLDLVCARPRAESAPLEAPAGEVWLSEAQVAEARIRVEPLAEQDVDDVIVTSGHLTFDDAQVARVSSPVAGRVVKIDAQLGQHVKKGDPLARIESPDVGLASAELMKAEAERITAEHEVARNEELFAAHATSQRDLERAQDGLRKATAEAVRARQKAALLRAGPGDAVTQTFVVRAPIEGEVVARNATTGMEVQGQYGGGSAQELFTVGELDRLWVLADVYEMDVPRVRVGSKMSVKLLALPAQKLDAKVEWISGTLDVATRTAKVRSSVDNRARTLKPEMYATVSIVVDERRTLAIPRSALLRIGEQTAVFVERGAAPDLRRVFARVPVAVDEAEGGRWVPISSGIAPGTPIVTGGAILLAGDR